MIFTSGGSESNSFLINGFLKPGDHFITTCIEHFSILKCCLELEKNGVEVTYFKVNSRGQIDFEDLRKVIKENTRLVSIMHVNNEIGAIQVRNLNVAIR